MRLSEEQFAKYKRDQRCPNCKGNRISWIDQEAGWCALRCDACKSTWTERYTLTSVVNYDPQEIKLTAEQKLQAELAKAQAEIERLRADK